jgi:hypothetical protein
MPFSIVLSLPCDLLLLFPRRGIIAAIDPDERHLAQVGQGMQRRIRNSAMPQRAGGKFAPPWDARQGQAGRRGALHV